MAIKNYKQIIKAIEINKDKIKKLDVSRIGLFGSFVKNKHRGKSDVDILVKFKRATFDNYAELLLLLERIFKRKIDLVFEERLRPEMIYIKKEVKYARL